MRTSSVNELILQLLCCDNVHLTAQDLYETLHTRLPGLNPSTVYRSLERMVKAGKISISDMGTGADVYELVQGENHHHLVCQSCGAVLTLPNSSIEQFLQMIKSSTGYELSTKHLVLFGTCPGCQQVAAGQEPG